MWTGGDIIHAYTRAQAIADGELVDATETAREAGFTVPVALTRAVWIGCVAWSDADTDRTGVPQDESGRLWDVVWMASLAARSGPGNQREFTVYRISRSWAGGEPEPEQVRLVLTIGPGDDSRPVGTIHEPGED